jgi:hypothetical protein
VLYKWHADASNARARSGIMQPHDYPQDLRGFVHDSGSENDMSDDDSASWDSDEAAAAAASDRWYAMCDQLSERHPQSTRTQSEGVSSHGFGSDTSDGGGDADKADSAPVPPPVPELEQPANGAEVEQEHGQLADVIEGVIAISSDDE